MYSSQPQQYEVEEECKKTETSCVVCQKENCPYKCPTCLKKYCSVDCCKTHKERGPCVKFVPVKEEPVKGGLKYNDYYYPTEDTIPKRSLRRLCEGENLKKMQTFLENKKIRSYIQILDSSDDPEPEFKAMMQDSEFVEFAAFATDVVTAPEDPTKSAYENYRIKARKELLDFFSGNGKGKKKKHF